MPVRKQSGYLFRSHGAWFIRYREDVRDPATKLVTRVQSTHRLGTTTELRTKTEAQQLADEFLAPLNTGDLAPNSSVTIGEFIAEQYFPFITRELRASSVDGYKKLWERYFVARISTRRLRDFRTHDGEKLMREIADAYSLRKATLAHIKNFLSGVFRSARRLGYLHTPNPMHDVSIPRGIAPPRETHAYSIEEVTRMLTILPEPAATMVAIAAFSGIRKSEIKGLQWPDITDEALYVRRGVWRGVVDDPKTEKSKAPVPLIGPLKVILRNHRAQVDSTLPYVFSNTLGGPLDPEHVARTIIRPALEKASIPWHGWHAFRRGLATNLYALGVNDKTIQLILRHSNVAVTQASYIKTLPGDTVAAMAKLENVIGTGTGATGTTPADQKRMMN